MHKLLPTILLSLAFTASSYAAETTISNTRVTDALRTPLPFKCNTTHQNTPKNTRDEKQVDVTEEDKEHNVNVTEQPDQPVKVKPANE